MNEAGMFFVHVLSDSAGRNRSRRWILMPEKGHWPFGGDPWARRVRGSNRASEADDAKAHSAEQFAMRQRVRHDRLIVGGRAHVKKSGLS